jgi:hypothetical protein
MVPAAGPAAVSTVMCKSYHHVQEMSRAKVYKTVIRTQNQSNFDFEDLN